MTLHDAFYEAKLLSVKRGAYLGRMPRKPSAPRGLVEGREYIAQVDDDLSDRIADYFATVAATFAAAADVARDQTQPLDARQRVVGELLARGRLQSEHAQRLVAEFVMHHGGTQRDAAELLAIHRTTAYNWWHDPIASDDLA